MVSNKLLGLVQQTKEVLWLQLVLLWHTSEVLLHVLVNVDDIIIIDNHQSSIDEFVKSLYSSFSLKDLGQLSYFLGIEVTYNSAGLFLSQQKYIIDLLHMRT